MSQATADNTAYMHRTNAHAIRDIAHFGRNVERKREKGKEKGDGRLSQNVILKHQPKNLVL